MSVFSARKMSALRWLAVSLSAALCHCAPIESSDAATDATAPMDRTAVFRDVPTMPFDAPPEHAPAPAGLTVTAVPVATGMINFGQLIGAASTATQRVFVGNTGSFWLNGLVLAGSTVDMQPWRGAASVPALDRPDTEWFIAINGMGELQRLRAFSEWVSVADQFGVAGQNLQQLVHAGGAVIGFRTATSLVMTEMATTRVYDGTFSAIGGGSQKVSGIIEGTVRLFTMGAMQQGWIAPGATSTTVDTMGNAVWSANGDLRTGAMDGTSTLRFRAAAGQMVRSLTRGAMRVWFIVGDELGTWDGMTVAVTNGLNLPANSQAIGERTGDVWVLTPMGPRRYSAGAVVISPQQRWEQGVQPVYAAKCFSCHGPRGGQTLLDSYNDWQMYRGEICNRVLRAMPRIMPPPNAQMLTAGERGAIDDWCMPPDAGMPTDAGVRDAARDVPTDIRG